MKRVLITVLVLGVSGFLLLNWLLFGDRSSFQSGLAQYTDLPAAASDITVYQQRNITDQFAADFIITETDFVSFAAENQWALEPITNSARIFYARAFHRGEPNDTKDLTNGLYYSKRAANGGGITVAYDRDGGRGYIERASR
jgi:hypothetical protein